MEILRFSRLNSPLSGLYLEVPLPSFYTAFGVSIFTILDVLTGYPSGESVLLWFEVVLFNNPPRPPSLSYPPPSYSYTFIPIE